MATMKVEVVSPERLLASVDADLARIPGQMGEFTALPGHAPFFSTLRPGLVTIQAAGETMVYFVTGGFAEVSPSATSVLAEEAVERDALTRGFLEARLADAEKALAAASADVHAAAAMRVNDFRTIMATLAL